jgi:sugar phosphate isomerase/epimerase
MTSRPIHCKVGAVHSRLSIDEICFAGASVAEFVDHARALGARRIALTSASLLASDANVQVVFDDGMPVETICHPFAVYPTLEKGAAQATDRLLEVIEIGARLNTRSIYLLTGGRGSLDWEAAAGRFVEAVGSCRKAAAARGIPLLIENAAALYADLHICHSLRDVLRLAEMAGMGVCIELFHCWAEAGLDQLIARAVPLCGLVQVSDYVLGDRALPNRAVPGDGTIPLERIIGRLLRCGYEGAFDIELIGPRIDAEGRMTATRRAAERLSEILVKLRA